MQAQNDTPISPFGHVLGYKLNNQQVFGLTLATTQKYSVYCSVGVYVADVSLDDQQIIDGVYKFAARKYGRIAVVQATADADNAANPNIRVRELDLEPKELKEIDSELIRFTQYTANCITFRLQGRLELHVPCVTECDKFESEVKAEIDRSRRASCKSLFHLKNSEYTILSSMSDSSPITELYSNIQDEYTDEISQMAGNKKARQKMLDDLIKQKVKSKEAIHFQFGLNMIEPSANPIAFIAGEKVTWPIGMDFVFQLDHRASISVLACLFGQALCNVHIQAEESLLEAFRQPERHIPQLKFYNYWHQDVSAAVITIAYPLHLSEDQLVENRRKICLSLHLPLDRPSIRRANAMSPDAWTSREDNRPLLNPHLSLLATPSKGKYHVVQGSYTYHHYMQDGFNDSGWGCAYRSLQTLISWFAQQGYIELNRMPTHHEIQKVLVDIDDKPASFVGSKRWIGSQEVGFVLNELYRIESKIICVSSGAELEIKGRQLANHFDSQGTPVMIGGGNLAHTILGVDFNENTGKLRFLVLDPHYTGLEDLNTILKKVFI